MTVAYQSNDVTVKFIGGALSLDFANTVGHYDSPDPQDALGTYIHLIDWGMAAGIITAGEGDLLKQKADSHPVAAKKALGYALGLRGAIHRAFSTIARGLEPGEDDVARINQAFAKSILKSKLHRLDHGFSWVWPSITEDLEAPVWPIAHAATQLLTSTDSLKTIECYGRDCTWLFVDHSKNHSRKWCDMETCGNRAKVRRHYARSKQR